MEYQCINPTLVNNCKTSNIIMQINQFRLENRDYFNLLNELFEAILIHDGNTILFINKQGLNFLGLKSEEHIIGFDIFNTQTKLSTSLKLLKSILLGDYCLENIDSINLKVKTSPVCLSEKTLSMTTIGSNIFSTNYNSNNLTKLITKTNSHYEELLNTLLYGIIIYKPINNGKNFIINYFNQSAEKLTHLKKDEVIGKDILDVFINIGNNIFYKTLIKVYETGSPQRIPKSYYKDRRIALWKENYLFKLHTGDIVSIFNDVEDSINLYNNLKKYSLLMDHTMDIILFVDSTGKIVEANKAAINAYGYCKEELLSKNIEDIRASNTVQLIPKQLKAAFSKGVFFETNHRTKNGCEFPVEVSSIGIDLEGSKITCSIVRDISERKKTELLLDENRKKLQNIYDFEKLRTEFIANLSHEFMTPLNIIFCSEQLLSLSIKNVFSQEDTLYRIQNNLNTIKENCNRLIKISNNFLDMSNIDSGFLKLTLSYCNIIKTVEEASSFAEQYTNKKGITLTLFSDVQEKFIICDKDKIQRIILNLLSNSIKFTPTGGKININITCTSNKYIEISVKDTGIGIPEDKQKFIFNKFTQIDKSFKRNNEGSGLGLFLVKALIDLHNGKIQVKSKPGRGSTFIIKIPFNCTESYQEATMQAHLMNREPYLEKAHFEFSDIYY